MSSANKTTTADTATRQQPSLAHLTRCQETLTAYLQHYITHNRPHRPITHLLICAGHPDPKILVAICTAEQFAFPCGYTLIQTRDPRTGEMGTVKKAVDGGRTIQFNGVEYEIVFKEGLERKEEGWMDEEKFVALFDELGRARRDVLFFDLVEFEESRAAQRGEELEREERAGKEREGRRREKKKEKKQKQRAKKAAAKKAGDEVASPEDCGEVEMASPIDGSETEALKVQIVDASDAQLPEKHPTWAEKASLT